MLGRGPQLHPGLALIVGTLVFFLGLMFVKSSWMPAFVLFLTILYLSAGFGKVMLRTACVILPLGLIMYLLTRINGTQRDAYYSFLRCVMLGFAATTTVALEPVRLVRWLNQRAVPRWITVGLLITVRFFTVMRFEIAQIRRAIRLRGIRFWGSPVLYARAFVLPLMIRVLSISELLAVSLETRGFQMDGDCTIFEPVRVRRKDLVFGFLFLAGLFVFTILFLRQGQQV